MGRIKSTLVKRTSKQLLNSPTLQFNDTFEHNKKMLGSTMPSKKMRNRIAGYMAHLIKLRRKQAEAALEAQKKPLVQEDLQYAQQ